METAVFVRTKQNFTVHRVVDPPRFKLPRLSFRLLARSLSRSLAVRVGTCLLFSTPARFVFLQANATF